MTATGHRENRSANGFWLGPDPLNENDGQKAVVSSQICYVC